MLTHIWCLFHPCVTAVACKKAEIRIDEEFLAVDESGKTVFLPAPGLREGEPLIGIGSQLSEL